MRPPLLMLLIVLFGPVTWVRAEPESKPSDPGDSPKAALQAQDAAAMAGKVEEDMSFYQSESEQQKTLARAAAELDVAVAKVRKAVEQKYGKELSAAVAHAAGTVDPHDIDAASEKVDGDKATLEWSRGDLPALHMVKTEGKWKVSLSEMLKDVDPGQVDQLTKSLQHLATELDKVDQLVEHDKFRSGQGVRDRVQELHDQAFADQP